MEANAFFIVGVILFLCVLYFIIRAATAEGVLSALKEYDRMKEDQIKKD